MVSKLPVRGPLRKVQNIYILKVLRTTSLGFTVLNNLKTNKKQLRFFHTSKFSMTESRESESNTTKSAVTNRISSVATYGIRIATSQIVCTLTGCFFYFGMFDIVIFWSIFNQKLCSWTFFISTFRSYFVKKITEHLCHYFSFFCIFRKATNFGEIFKNNPFSEEITTKLQQNCHNFMISTKNFIKIVFFNSKHSKQYKKIPKKFQFDP